MKKKISNRYEDKELNSMILFLRLNRLAEIQYIDVEGQNKFYDYIKKLSWTREEVIICALDNDWKLKWKKGFLNDR